MHLHVHGCVHMRVTKHLHLVGIQASGRAGKVTRLTREDGVGESL